MKKIVLIMLLVMGISFVSYSFLGREEATVVIQEKCSCPSGYLTKTQVLPWETIETYPDGTVKQFAPFRCSNGPDFDVLIACYRTGNF